MSQEKVDKYKQEKANRKKTMAKEKLKKKLYILLGAVITAAFVAWIGWSVYTEKKAAAEQESMIASLQAELNAMVATTGTAGTTGTGDATTADTTTSDDKSSSEETTEEETTTSADEKNE